MLPTPATSKSRPRITVTMMALVGQRGAGCVCISS
jgi:hypothetical protein